MNKYLSLLIILLCIMAVQVQADGLEIGGKIKQVLNYQFDQGLQDAETLCLIELEQYFGFKGKFYLVMEGNYDELEGKGELNLGEVYADIYLDQIDFSIGIQVINWGTADGINPTNSINPLNPDSFLQGELKGQAVPALQGVYYGDNIFITAVIITDYLPQDLSLIQQEMPVELVLPAEPVNKVENMELALQAETNYQGYDLKYTYFYGWDDLPALISSMEIDPITRQPKPETMQIKGVYRKINKVGIATAGILSELGVWAELAYILPEEIGLPAGGSPLEQQWPLSSDDSYIQGVIGADYTLDNGLYLQGQYLYYGNGSLFYPYHGPGETISAAQYLMGHLAYTINSKNSLEANCLYSISDSNGLFIPTYTYSFSQLTDLKVGVVLGIGDSGEFDTFPNQLLLSWETRF